MTRNIGLIENITKRKISFKKRHKTFLKRAFELNTICDVELAIIVNSPDHDEPKIFPNNDDVISSFEKFRNFPAKSTMTQEELTKQRIEKIEEQLQKVRKKKQGRGVHKQDV
ncbi:hypothetical protein MTR67_006281 [Solanum verrucosum]|uniref:MADS-box domain-containing protein n=1 Tax=Solanum verrucosum TaxID=315347 RepID=A0AAF0Q2V1_SOLVR|nr:hypothetical protein MTR67_006281 [Solanum verrucosum]